MSFIVGKAIGWSAIAGAATLLLPLSPTAAHAQGAVVIVIKPATLSARRPRATASEPFTPAVLTIGPGTEVAGAPIRFSRTVFSAPPVTVTAPLSDLPRSAPALDGLVPVSGVLTSRFGMRFHPILGIQREHLGVDLAAPIGTPVAATADGVVTRAQWQGGYGLLVELDNGGGTETRFGHLSRLNVNVGQRLRKGDILGFVGSTGLSTGPHVHYEVRIDGRAVDPLRSRPPGTPSPLKP